ncbi:MAG: phosphotransferase [Deltaproteobacteria bacterium]|nr:phosphotransferase [Deltaproteobacteria bacterium]MBW2397080.1 phosphotransferase [Deltaproteobacteria bacterium]
MEHPDDVIRAVADLALPEWDVGAAKVELVSRSENVVFRVDAEDERTFALRVHRPGYHTLAELESEALWTEALSQAGIGVPLAVPTRAGGHYAVVGVPGTDEVRHVGLIPWFEGVPLSETIEKASGDADRDSQFEQLGRLMARMHDQAVAWRPPSQFQRHALDADGFMGEAPFWGRFWDIPQLTPEQRKTLIDARARIHAQLSEYGKERGTYSVIHADLRSTNVLVKDDRVFVIDFDDAGFGWHQYDLAVVLFDYVTTPDYQAIEEALIAGYRSQRAISDEGLALLPMFVLVRMLASLGWLNDRPEVELYKLLPVLIELSCVRAREFLADSF